MVVLFMSCDAYYMDDERFESFFEIISVTVSDNTKSLLSDRIGSGESIGVFIFDSKLNSVETNMQFISEGGGETQKWDSDKKLLLGPSSLVAYGYYPYNSDMTNIESIPLDISNQCDYLYSKGQNVNQSNKRCSLTMYHALSVIRLNIRRTVESNALCLTKVLINGYNFSNSGYLNGLSGTVTGNSNKGSYLWDQLLSLSTEYQTVDILVIPNSNYGVMNASIVIDNSTYDISFGSLKLESSKIYSYDLVFDHSSLYLEHLTISPWISLIGQEGHLISDKNNPIISYVDANGNEVFCPSPDCIGVVLHAEGKRLMIEKKEYENAVYTQVFQESGFTISSNAIYDDFVWGIMGSTMNDLLTITNYTTYSWLTSKLPWAHIPDMNGNYHAYFLGNTIGLPSTWPTDPQYAFGNNEGSNQTYYLSRVTSTDKTVSSALLGLLAYKFVRSSDALGYSDWYIPTIRQLGLISVYKSMINEALLDIGGVPIGDKSYWSSTESNADYSWYVDMLDGYVTKTYKNFAFSVRFVRDF